MNLLASRSHEAVVFVGPARSGKTQGLIDCWSAYAVMCDPGDMLLYFPTEGNALDYARRRIRRMYDHSPLLAAQLSTRGHDNNLASIIYRHGMILSLGWPSSSQFAQRDARYVALSDYDSMPSDIDGEGSPFDLARKRVQAMMSAGMCMVESSPKRAILTDDWVPATRHEAPPTDGGIMELYNRGDRRRWYWRCLHCGEPFEAPPMPAFDPHEDIERAAASARVDCPACGSIHAPAQKPALRLTGHWVADDAVKDSPIASFWARGCAAAFQPWHSLVRNYLIARRVYEQTGDEGPMKSTLGIDQATPYLPRSMQTGRSAAELRDRAEWWPVREVPAGVRYLHAAVDVQGSRFVVQVVGRGVGGERWLVDRYQIRDSPTRTDSDGSPLPLDPAGYLEDWAAITAITGHAYPLADRIGQRMPVRLIGVDSGGGVSTTNIIGDSSVTSRAYQWWRSLRRSSNEQRFRLLKGHAGGVSKPLVWRTFPESARKSTVAAARGDIPIHWVNTLTLKDGLDADLRREEAGAGYIHLPEWAEEELFAELCAEVRMPRRWERRGRNEAWDLMVYEAALDQISAWESGGWRSPKLIDWAAPPRWAEEWDLNSSILRDGTETAGRPTRKRANVRPRGLGSEDWASRL